MSKKPKIDRFFVYVKHIVQQKYVIFLLLKVKKLKVSWPYHQLKRFLVLLLQWLSYIRIKSLFCKTVYNQSYHSIGSVFIILLVVCRWANKQKSDKRIPLYFMWANFLFLWRWAADLKKGLWGCRPRRGGFGMLYVHNRPLVELFFVEI